MRFISIEPRFVCVLRRLGSISQRSHQLFASEVQEEVCVVAAENVFQVFSNIDVSIGLLQFVFATFRDAEQEDGVEINGTDVFFLREFFALNAEAALLAGMIS